MHLPLRGRRARESRSTIPGRPDRLQQPSYRASGPRTSMTRRDGDRRHARGSEARARRRQSQRRARCPRMPREPNPAVPRMRSRWRKAPGAFLSPAAATARSSTVQFRPTRWRESRSHGRPPRRYRPRLCRLEPAPSRRRAGIRAECRQITRFEASFGFQCSAHSSAGEFPLEL